MGSISTTARCWASLPGTAFVYVSPFELEFQNTSLFDVDSSRWTSVDLGLLVLRVGIGVSFVFVYGASKMFGGPGTWSDLGQNMAIFGVTVWPTFWGFLSAFAEFAGGILLILGLFFRPVLVLLLLNMTVATSSHLAAGEGPWHATEMATVFLVLLLLGPGRYSLDAWLCRPTGEDSTS